MSTLLVILLLSAGFLCTFKSDEKYEGGFVGAGLLVIFLYLVINVHINDNEKYYERCIEDLQDEKKESIESKQESIKKLKRELK